MSIGGGLKEPAGASSSDRERAWTPAALGRNAPPQRGQKVEYEGSFSDVAGVRRLHK